jgi:deoxyribose-phosphate aldolase
MDLAQIINHTILKPGCVQADIERLCQEAVQYTFGAVCLPPFFVRNAVRQLVNHPVILSTVVGFPMGYSTTSAKVEEIKRAIDEGATEFDAVVNLCAVKNGNWNYVRNEAESLTTACHMRGKIIKLIIETSLLDEGEIRKLCEICAEVKVDYVKTSTGFNGPGATMEAVQLLRKYLPIEIKITASGGTWDRQYARQLVEAGANRLGCSSGIAIVTER